MFSPVFKEDSPWMAIGGIVIMFSFIGILSYILGSPSPKPQSEIIDRSCRNDCSSWGTIDYDCVIKCVEYKKEKTK